MRMNKGDFAHINKVVPFSREWPYLTPVAIPFTMEQVKKIAVAKTV